MELLERLANASEPRERVRLRQWSIRNAFTQDGKPYDHDAYPHHGAPGGPMDAFDCPQYLLDLAAMGQPPWQVILRTMRHDEKTADCDAMPDDVCQQRPEVGVEVTQRTYRMLEYCERWRDHYRRSTVRGRTRRRWRLPRLRFLGSICLDPGG
jgi:hypothetical protein